MGCSSQKNIKVVFYQSFSEIPSDTFFITVKTNASSSQIGSILYQRITEKNLNNNPMNYDIKITFDVGGLTTSNFKLLNKTKLIYVNLTPKLKI